MIISKELFTKNVKDFNIDLKDVEIEMFDKYAQMLIDCNKKFNLTAIKEPDEIVLKHFVDSLSIMNTVEFCEGQTLIDVGTGAGFPGIPLLIMNPQLDITFLDSTGKKLIFIESVLDELSLFGETLNSRAEEVGQNPDYRESFDFATARAVSELRNIAEFCLPLVKKGGTFIAMKGSKVEEEIAQSENALKTLGGKIENNFKFELPSCGERSIIHIKKISQTPTKYPRNFSQITKHPIR
ncbi:MAG: 16S rRNA (guanine(527)-N(7))-methyltransferase RsmG [Clostridia bacterium]|nr:16S rRNA (guanine(527)-N(7))-methyltransferase RsmG [Clostridia bacterium]